MKTLTPRAAAEQLGISERTIPYYVKRGLLTPIRLNQRKFLYKQSQIDRLLRSAT